MGKGSGKGGTQTATVKLPKEIREAAERNIKLAKQVARLPYAPYFAPSIAAFTPAQQAAFKSADQASAAFGMPTSGGTGLPKPQDVGGFKGYSTKDIYEQALSMIPPEVLAMYEQFFTKPRQSQSNRQPSNLNIPGLAGLAGTPGLFKPTTLGWK